MHARRGLHMFQAVALAILLMGATACDLSSDVYTTRAKVSEGLNLAGAAKIAVAEFHQSNNRFPANNEEAGLAAAETINGNYVSSVNVLPGGKVAVIFGGSEPDPAIAGRVLLIETVGPDNDGHFKWNCLAPAIERRDLPSVCRSDGKPRYRPVIFYLHGRIVEDGELRPVHSEWGLYDYPAVVEALGRQGAAVVSERRPADADMDVHAAKVVNDIERLLGADFPPEHIAVVGFSKGAGIATRVSSRLDNPDIRYALLAGCGAGVERVPGLIPNGHVLSIVETSDTLVGTCDGLAGRNPDLADYRELTITTGEKHGAFYLPRDEWLEPVLDWAHHGNTEASQ